MAAPGDELVNPATGLRTVFRRTAGDTGGELLQVEWIGESRWTTGPDHVHRSQDERFEVLAGRLGLRVDGDEHVLTTGDVLSAPAGAPHAAWNAGDEEVRVLVDFRPALRTETAFETLAALAQEGRTTRAGAPRNPLLAALILRHFEAEIYFVRPPLAVQRALLGPLAALARALGMRAERPYPYPSALLRGSGLTQTRPATQGAIDKWDGSS
jgi:quercetin dioxygenase-like cupin family protein